MRSNNINSTNGNRLAAVFLDYENLYQTLDNHLEGTTSASEYINEVLSELRRYLADADQIRVVNSVAYADFSTFTEQRPEIERELFARGTEPRYVPSHLQSNVSELQLCVDALEVLHSRPEIQTYVLISGNQEYYPLVHQLSAYGRDVIVVVLEAPAPEESPMQAEGDVFLDMMNLLGDDGRRALSSNLQQDRRGFTQPQTAFSPLENPISYQTLEIAEEYFGQYEEIYLTPLLRKLSEVLGSQYDPKSIISDLEDAGAVRLEKREGYPYNYTVLIINDEHPDVREIHERYYSDGRSASYARSTSQERYDYDGAYEEDGYTEDFDEESYDTDYAPSSTDSTDTEVEVETDETITDNEPSYWEEDRQA